MVSQRLRLAGEEREDVLGNLLREVRVVDAPQRTGVNKSAEGLDKGGKSPLAPPGGDEGLQECSRIRSVFFVFQSFTPLLLPEGKNGDGFLMLSSVFDSLREPFGAAQHRVCVFGYELAPLIDEASLAVDFGQLGGRDFLNLPVVGEETVDLALDVGGLGVDTACNALLF